MKWIKNVFAIIAGRKIGNLRILPIATKIVLIYILFILLSNFSSHYISLMLYRGEMVKLMRQLMVKDLKDIYNFANTQYEIFHFSGERGTALRMIEEKTILDFKNKRSLMLGINREGQVEMSAARILKTKIFSDMEILSAMTESLSRNEKEGFISFSFGDEKYFGVYKYNPNWEMFLIRAEEYSEFYEESNKIFRRISLVILIITFACAVAGVFIIDYVLRFIRSITNDIIEMIGKNKLGFVNMEGSQDDDVTFLGMSFNTLADTIGRMMKIFQKFTNRDIVIKAYEERKVELEGSRRELTCLFSDIKSFTYMTEVLGTDIITLLNLHYSHVINIILKHDGIIGSIIGDALLAVYGVFDGKSARRKSYQAVITGYKTQEAARDLRTRMELIKEKIIAENGSLTPLEEKVYRAVLIEVGVGIDGGAVFYGNIGSYERMTNTVIGDTVNSASRLEGLNRIYHAPVICSEYIKNDIVDNVPVHGLEFIELDIVRVKGKTEGKKVFWPIFKKDMTPSLRRGLRQFSSGLKLYYRGEWEKAHVHFKQCPLPMAEVFIDRTRKGRCPKNWNGIWAMGSK